MLGGRVLYKRPKQGHLREADDRPEDSNEERRVLARKNNRRGPSLRGNEENRKNRSKGATGKGRRVAGGYQWNFRALGMRNVQNNK